MILYLNIVMNSGEEGNENTTTFNEKLRSSIGVVANSQLIMPSRATPIAATNGWIENQPAELRDDT